MTLRLLAVLGAVACLVTSCTAPRDIVGVWSAGGRAGSSTFERAGSAGQPSDSDGEAGGELGGDLDAQTEDSAAAIADGQVDSDAPPGSDSTCPPDAGGGPTVVYRVVGARLCDPCGKVVLLRGVNEMASSSDRPTGDAWLGEIARTGANAVRLRIGNPGAILSDLDVLLANCERNQLIAVVTIDEPSGNWSQLSAILDQWVSSSVLQVLRKHESHLLLDVAEALGDEQLADDTWVFGYTNAIQRLRAAGLHLPLVIGGPMWGARAKTVLDRGKDVLAADPQHNTMLAISSLRSWNTSLDDQVAAMLATASARNLPLVLTAFAPSTRDCTEQVSYRNILSQSAETGTGWMAWSWGAVDNPGCSRDNMAAAGLYDGLTDWGREVSVTSSYGIRATSVRTSFQKTGNCGE